MNWLPLLLAEGEDPGFRGLLGSPIIPLMIALFVFMIFSMRTKARESRELQSTLSKVKKNDKVVTRAGILGVVVAVKENEDEVTLRVDDTSNSRIRVLKSSIVNIITEEQQQAAQAAENKTT